MAQAECLNENCERGQWSLRKHPDDYKGGVSCPDCGTTRVDVQHDGGQQGRGSRGGRQGGHHEGKRPVRREGRNQGSGRPAPRAEGQRASGAITEAAALFDDDVSTGRRAEAATTVFGGIGRVVEQFLHYQDQKKKAMEQRAESVELENSDLPRCKAELEDGSTCGYQFSPEDIGVSDGSVRCPDCKSLYEISDPRPD